MDSYLTLSKSQTLLFKSLKVMNTGGILLAALVCLFAAVFSEVLDGCKMRLERKELQGDQHGYQRGRAKCCCRRVFLSTIHLLFRLIRYLLMLIAMTYDVVLLTAVIVGAGLGYFLTDSWKRGLTGTYYPESDHENRNVIHRRLVASTNDDHQNTALLMLDDISETNV